MEELPLLRGLYSEQVRLRIHYHSHEYKQNICGGHIMCFFKKVFIIVSRMYTI